MTGRGKALVRGVFLLAPLYVLAQHVVTSHIGEPYPAIALPAFGGKVLDSGGEQHVIAPRMTVMFTDGSRAALDHNVLFADVGTLRLTLAKRVFLDGRNADGVVQPVTRSGLADLFVHGAAPGMTYAVHGRPVTQDPRFLSWLRGRLAALYPDRTAAELQVRWVIERYRLPGGYRGDDPRPVSLVTVRLR
jgi:hypothetical protein